jgi:hypothetical protein
MAVRSDEPLAETSFMLCAATMMASGALPCASWDIECCGWLDALITCPEPEGAMPMDGAVALLVVVVEEEVKRVTFSEPLLVIVARVSDEEASPASTPRPEPDGDTKLLLAILWGAILAAPPAASPPGAPAVTAANAAVAELPPTSLLAWRAGFASALLPNSMHAVPEVRSELLRISCKACCISALACARSVASRRMASEDSDKTASRRFVTLAAVDSIMFTACSKQAAFLVKSSS